MTAVVLSDYERNAAGVILSASRAELLSALATLPSFQRIVVRWLARAILRARDPVEGEGYVAILDRQRARKRARDVLEDLRARVAAAAQLPAEEQVALQARLTALWEEAEAAMGEIGEEPVFPTVMTTTGER